MTINPHGTWSYEGNASPPNAYAALRYRDHWFWIDDRDMQSKTLFNVLLLIFSLTETGGPQASPIVTVPVR